jgi:hypothetical protein
MGLTLSKRKHPSGLVEDDSKRARPFSHHCEAGYSASDVIQRPSGIATVLRIMTPDFRV